jgi:hypothetical protein
MMFREKSLCGVNCGNEGIWTHRGGISGAVSGGTALIIGRQASPTGSRINNLWRNTN